MALDIARTMTDEVVELALAGDLDAATAPRLRAALEDLVGRRPRRVVLRVADLEHLGGAGLRVLVMAKQRLGDGTDVHIVAPRRAVLETLRRAGLHHSFLIRDVPDAGPGLPPIPGRDRVTLDPLVVPAAVESLAAVGRYARAAAAAGGLAEEAAARLRLAVEEIATNAVTHGSAGSIELRADVDGRAVRVILEAGGPEFDPRTVPPPADLDRPAEERRAGGLGVYLALRAVDGFDYRRVDGRNRHYFVMHRPRA